MDEKTKELINGILGAGEKLKDEFAAEAEKDKTIGEICRDKSSLKGKLDPKTEKATVDLINDTLEHGARIMADIAKDRSINVLSVPMILGVCLAITVEGYKQVGIPMPPIGEGKTWDEKGLEALKYGYALGRFNIKRRKEEEGNNGETE